MESNGRRVVSANMRVLIPADGMSEEINQREMTLWNAVCLRATLVKRYRSIATKLNIILPTF